MKKPLVRLLVFSFLYLASFVSTTEGFFHKRQQPLPAGQDLFKKLRIERFSEKVPAPDFTLADLNRKRIRLDDLRGKVVFLNFWATWCPPCRLEMPSMERLYQRLKDRDFVMLAVDMQETEKLVKAFFREFNLSFTALMDRDGDVSFLYGIRGIPTTYIIGPKGNIIGKAVGPREWASKESMRFFEGLL